MGAGRKAFLLSGTLLALPLRAGAHGWGSPEAGSLVQVEVSVDGRATPLYPAPDGSGRFYLEARKGACYEVRLVNRTGDRLGVVLVVDGLNAISGERASAGSSGNRMYVLGPWDETGVRGWRTSLSEVRRFTFVDERSSYAARSRKASGKMGWIEVGVFRERHRPSPWWADPWVSRDAPPGTAAPGPEGADRAEKSREGADSALGGRAPQAKSYPGTGWGGSAYDPAEVVSFTPEPRPAELVTLRYEYAPGLRALGILEAPYRDRLSERERGEWGFAQPPRW